MDFDKLQPQMQIRNKNKKRNNNNDQNIRNEHRYWDWCTGNLQCWLRFWFCYFKMKLNSFSHSIDDFVCLWVANSKRMTQSMNFAIVDITSMSMSTFLSFFECYEWQTVRSKKIYVLKHFWVMSHFIAMWMHFTAFICAKWMSRSCHCSLFVIARQ